MTKKKINLCIVALATFFIVGFTTVLFSGTRKVEATGINYKQKIVSVLFDNSFSMTSPVEENKTELAKYSLEMLATLLSGDDELYLWPMNAAKGEVTSAFKIELDNDLKMAEINQKIIHNPALSPTGETPPSSIEKALSTLRGKGLKTSSDQIVDEESNVEYWLVILTDGAFSGGKKSDVVLEEYIKDYVGLNTIYLAFGAQAANITGSAINNKYPISTYHVPNPQSIISAMQDVANKISGRYSAEKDNNKYIISGNDITVDLDKFPFAVNNIAVMVQDSGAKLVSATYNDKILTVSQGSVLEGDFPKTAGGQPDTVKILEDGYAAVVKDGEYMSGGQVVFTFDKSVGDNVSVLVEPAIYIDVTLERESTSGWEKTDLQYINTNMRPDEKIRVKYKVYGSSDNREISLQEIFGKPVEKITYCGEGYDVGESIPLRKGKNSIYVSVSVLNGHYTMYTNIICMVEDNPGYYRIDGVLREGTGDRVKQTEASYYVYDNNEKVNKNALSGYTVDILVTYPDGSQHNLDYSINSDGEILTCFDGEGLVLGEYVITAKVINNENQLTKTNRQSIYLMPKTIEAVCLNSDSLQISEHALVNVEHKVRFGLKLDGKDSRFDDSGINYTVQVGGVNVKDKCKIEDGQLVFSISSKTLPEISIGKKKLELNVNYKGKLSNSAFYEFEIVNSFYAVENIDKGTNQLDVYHLRSTEAAVYFKICRDGVFLSEDEIQTALSNGEITVDTQPFGWISLLPCKVDILTENIGSETVIICKVGDDMAAPWDSLLSSFIFANQKAITLKYNGVSATGVIEINNLSFVDRLWRWIIILAIILFLLHIITYILGFFIAKPLPRGTMLKFNIGNNLSVKMSTPMAKKVNIQRKEIFAWHLSRFIPFREFKNQKPRSFWGDVEMRVDKKTRRVQLIAKKDMVELLFTAMSTNDGRAVQEMLEGYKHNHASRRPNVSKRAFMSFLRRRSNEKIKKGEIQSVYGWYGIIQKMPNGRQEMIKSVITFMDLL